jgi:DNA-binding NarL/FixJ family response regulator
MVDKKWGSEQKYPQFIHSQQQLLSYIKAGREIKWIASTLNTTSGNIRNALSRIYRKIGVLNSREALRIIENFQLISRSYSVSH